jgi:hypothetical protein
MPCPSELNSYKDVTYYLLFTDVTHNNDKLIVSMRCMKTDRLIRVPSYEVCLTGQRACSHVRACPHLTPATQLRAFPFNPFPSLIDSFVRNISYLFMAADR